MSRLRAVFNAARSLPALFWMGVAGVLMIGSAVTLAYMDGRSDVRAEVATAIIKDEAKVAKAQTKLTDLTLKRLDEKIGRDAGIDERTDDARRRLDAVEVAPSGDAFADRLAALRAYRAVNDRLRDDILAGREDYLKDDGGAGAPRPVRSSRPAYG